MDDDVRIGVDWSGMRRELSGKPIIPTLKTKIFFVRWVMNKIPIIYFITRKPSIVLSI